METLKQGTDALFILLGGIMVLAMHAGFAFLELGTVVKRTRSMPLSKFGGLLRLHHRVFVVGYGVAYGTHFFIGANNWPPKTDTSW